MSTENKLKAIGTIVRIGEVQQVTDTFKKLEFVLEIDKESQYPQKIQFQVSQDKADKFKEHNKVGQDVEVSFNLRGRDWTNKDGEVKTFNTLDAWFISSVNSGDKAPEAKQEIEDDLPF